MADRTVHAITRWGARVVRYDRSGKWYRESDGCRDRITLEEAVVLATGYGATVYFGLPGGMRFDAEVRKAAPNDS